MPLEVHLPLVTANVISCHQVLKGLQDEPLYVSLTYDLPNKLTSTLLILGT